MPDTTVTDRRPLRLLAGAWLFAAAAVVMFAWQTAGSYIRQNFRTLPGEGSVVLAECRAVPTCAQDAVSTIQGQLSLLRQATLLVHWSVWTTTLAAVLFLLTATVLVLRRGQPTAARVLRIAWKTEVAGATILLVAHVLLLSHGASVLGDTPEAARIFTFAKAFDSPFTDIGHLYYLAWFIAVSTTTVIFTWKLSRELTTHGQQYP